MWKEKHWKVYSRQREPFGWRHRKESMACFQGTAQGPIWPGQRAQQEATDAEVKQANSISKGSQIPGRNGTYPHSDCGYRKGCNRPLMGSGRYCRRNEVQGAAWMDSQDLEIRSFRVHEGSKQSTCQRTEWNDAMEGQKWWAHRTGRSQYLGKEEESKRNNVLMPIRNRCLERSRFKRGETRESESVGPPKEES